MKICFFTKYPPTEGEVSSRSYWLARGLAEKGIEVHIITDSLEEKLNREELNFEDSDDLTNFQPPNIYVHSLDALECLNPKSTLSKNPLLFRNYESRLASLGIEVIERYQCDVIDSHYLLPHGVAAYLAKKITGCPLILRTAVSDIAKVIYYREFHPLFRKIFAEADLVFTHQAGNIFFQELELSSQKLRPAFNYGVNSKYFNPQVPAVDLNRFGLKIDSQLPVITYIGKIGHVKGIYELVKAASQIKEGFLLLFVSAGPGLEQFKKYIKKFPGLKGKYHFLGFIPPWKIPAVLKRSRCLTQLERDFALSSHFPHPPLEAMAVGVCPLISEEIYETYKNLPGIEKDKNILVVNPKNIKELKDLLEKLIKNKNFSEDIGQEAQKIFDQRVFPTSVSAMIKIYEDLIKNGKSLKACLEELREVILKHISHLKK